MPSDDEVTLQKPAKHLYIMLITSVFNISHKILFHVGRLHPSLEEQNHVDFIIFLHQPAY